MGKEKYPQKHYPGSEYPGIKDEDLIKVEIATINLWTGRLRLPFSHYQMGKCSLFTHTKNRVLTIRYKRDIPLNTSIKIIHMEKEKYTQKHYPGSKYPGIRDEDLIREEVATVNLWTGKVTPTRFIFPNGKVITVYPYQK